ncbi:MAG: helix-turn-helix transcriptional regulator [Betaproteobacteria bacterium]|nr:helix-turn-helix transcriptional regulator [Betaproteobacteria bacterium]
MNPLPALLGLLAPGERYGYQLKAQIDRELAPFWRLDYAQLYRTLARAAGEGLARVREERSAHGPPRKRYALTAAGRRAFEAWLHAPSAAAGEILVKMHLAHGAGKLTAALRARLSEALAAERAALEARIAAGSERADGAASPIVGSDDPLLARLGEAAGLALETRGSYGGLWALSRGETDAAAVHLRDPDTREYNAPFIRRLLPEDDVLLVNLAWRDTGLLLAPGNPLGIRRLADLARADVRLVNRQPSAGTRLLLLLELRAAGMDASALRGWDDVRPTHAAVAEAVRSGAADVGPGLRAVADAHGLEFLPLARERYDLAVRRRFFDSAAAEPLHRALSARTLRRAASGLAGYDLADSGRVIERVR